MRRPIRALEALALAGLLTAVTPADARAAGGTFVYSTKQGTERHSLTDPVDGRCYPVGEAAGVTGNETDHDAYLYDTEGCRGAAVYFPSRWYGYETFHSVMFVARCADRTPVVRGRTAFR
ncbi:hypothetical protein ACMATS_04860 [Streptoverticillium reticulum]|uniref:hypothetical protein n=1 Tax=Streptoverticillium reticulum TaxID=1433415 RepID=UPI0039BFFD5D